ncbi:MAG: hypothetical protein V4555_03285 [Acidobacteriota bacterium]
MPAAGPNQPPVRVVRHASIQRDRAAAESQRQQSLLRRAHLEHSSLLRGLLLFAAAALTFAILRAGIHRAFVPGWWRQW